ALFEVGRGASAVSKAVLGTQSQRLGVVGDGGLGVTLAEVRQSAIVPGPGVVGTEGQRTRKVGDPVVVIAFAAVGDAAIVERDRDVVLRIASAGDDFGAGADGALRVLDIGAARTRVLAAGKAAAGKRQSEGRKSAHFASGSASRMVVRLADAGT